MMSHPGSSRGDEQNQLGEGVQVLVKARADLLSHAVVSLVILPQGDL